MALLTEVDARPGAPKRRAGSSLSPTTRYVLSRVGAAIGTLVFVVIFNFFLFRVMPGDPVALYTRGRNVDPDAIRRLTARLHAPLWEQFQDYIRNPFSGNGPSVKYSAPSGPTFISVGCLKLASGRKRFISTRSPWASNFTATIQLRIHS